MPEEGRPSICDRGRRWFLTLAHHPHWWPFDFLPYFGTVDLSVRVWDTRVFILLTPGSPDDQVILQWLECVLHGRGCMFFWLMGCELVHSCWLVGFR